MDLPLIHRNHLKISLKYHVNLDFQHLWLMIISPRIGYNHLYFGNAFTNEYSYYIRDSKWILMICETAKSKKTANWLEVEVVSTGGRDKPSGVGPTLGRKLICASFSLL